MSEQLYPLAVLMEEMKSEDAETRINAMRRLSTVAEALGPERTRKELIPFLGDQMEDDDEVLLVMATELGKFTPLVGGVYESVCLISVLGFLAMVEETVVRDKAVESANTIISNLDSAAIVVHVVPVIQKLAQGDWFTARVSACGLFAIAYKRITDPHAKGTLRSLYSTLCQDDTPMVRRAAAKHIGELASVVERECVVPELLPLFTALAGDDQDSVRLLAIENCTAFAKVMGPADIAATILPLTKSCAGDKSWRVRNNVARDFEALSEAMGGALIKTDLLPIYVKLLRDPEAEVRGSASKNLPGYHRLIGTDRFLVDVLPAIRDCGVDPSQAVRQTFAEALMEVAGRLTHDQAEKSVTPLILNFLMNKEEAPEVRLKVLEHLHKVVDTIGTASLEKFIVGALLSLGVDALWRVREKVVEQLPLMAKALGPAIFEEKLMPMLTAAYQDQVNAVRMSATRTLQPLARVLGLPWVRAKLLPKLVELYNAEGSSYLQRITVLYGIRDLSVHPDMAELAHELLPLVLRGLQDTVPNVRFVAAQVIQDALPILDRSKVNSVIKPALATLADVAAGDLDVQYFASVALEKA